MVPVPECWEDELMPIIKGLVLENSAINTDGSYDGLILNGYEHHRVYHSKGGFARGKCPHKRHPELLGLRLKTGCINSTESMEIFYF